MNNYLKNKFQKIIGYPKVREYFKITNHPEKNNYLVLLEDGTYEVVNPVLKISLALKKLRIDGLVVLLANYNMAYSGDFTKQNDYVFILKDKEVILIKNTDLLLPGREYKIASANEKQIYLRKDDDLRSYVIIDIEKKEVFRPLKTKGLMHSRKKIYYKNQLIVNVNDNTFDLYENKVKMSLFKMKKNNWFINYADIIYEDNKKIFFVFKLRTEKNTARTIYFKYSKDTKKIDLLDSTNTYKFIFIGDKLFKYNDNELSYIDFYYVENRENEISKVIEINPNTLEEKDAAVSSRLLISIVEGNFKNGFNINKKADTVCIKSKDNSKDLFYEELLAPKKKPVINYKGKDYGFLFYKRAVSFGLKDNWQTEHLAQDKIIFTTECMFILKNKGENTFDLIKIEYTQELEEKIKNTYEYKVIYEEEKVLIKKESYERYNLYDFNQNTRTEYASDFTQIYNCKKFNNYYEVILFDVSTSGTKYNDFHYYYTIEYITNVKKFIFNKSNKMSSNLFLNFNCRKEDGRIESYFENTINNERNNKYSNIKKISNLLKTSKKEIAKISIKNKLFSEYYNGGF